MLFIELCINGLLYIWNQQMRGFSFFIFAVMSLVGIFLAFVRIFTDCRIKGRKFDTFVFLIWSIWIIYICFMFQIAIYRREPGSEHRIRTDIDLGSFHGDFIAAYQVGYCALNMLFFVPYGFLLALIRLHKEKDIGIIKTVFMTTMCSFLGSTFIELTQLATGTGIFEITDIVINSFGGMLGTLLAIAMARILFIFSRRKNE